MKSSQKLLILFIFLTNFGNVDAMFAWNKKPSKHVTFNEVNEVVPAFQYESEENDPMEWQTQDEETQARSEGRTEKGMTLDQANNLDIKKRYLMQRRVQSMKGVKYHFPEKNLIEKYEKEIVLGIVFTGMAATSIYTLNHLIKKWSDPSQDL